MLAPRPSTNALCTLTTAIVEHSHAAEGLDVGDGSDRHLVLAVVTEADCAAPRAEGYGYAVRRRIGPTNRPVRAC
jgi:hypothetical protein